MKINPICLFVLPIMLLSTTLLGQQRALEALDVFKLSYVDQPAFSPDGKKIAFLKRGFDIMTDKGTSQVWTVNFDGSDLRPLSSAGKAASAPIWSPDGSRLAWVSIGSDGHQLIVRYNDASQESVLTTFEKNPSSITWSPDGKWLAYLLFVPKSDPGFIKMPAKPEGAEWADQAKYTSEIVYRRDGSGELPDGFNQLFIMSANGGAPVMVSDFNYNVNGPLAWSADSRMIYLSGQDQEKYKGDFYESDLFRVMVESGETQRITDKSGADAMPIVSVPRNHLAWLGFANDYNSHQQMEIYFSANRRMTESEVLTNDLDRTVNEIQWNPEGTAIWFSYEDNGKRRINAVGPTGEMLMDEPIANLSGNPVGRPYSGGTFAVGPGGRWVATLGNASRPAELYVGTADQGDKRKLTDFNGALFLNKKPAETEEFWIESSFDGQKVQGWIVYPPDFDASKKYPLLLEIHGGPHTTYGDFFSMEIQQYANSGYVVVYTNPRGSTSYGSGFAQLIQHDYPGKDYDDLMSCVDEVVGRGYIDEDRLYVTGGSGGGILTAWIVCKTDRFRAAVSAKPVINWVSEALTSDIPLITKYWFPAMPWEDFEAYWKRSPLAYVDKVTTPTLMMVGSIDYRTPLSEAEQFYRALKLHGVETGLVRFPDSYHGIASRPSRMLAKTGAIMGWFERFDGPKVVMP